MKYYNQLLSGLSLIVNSYCDKSGTRCILRLKKPDNYSLAIKDICDCLKESDVEYQLFDAARLESMGITDSKLGETNPSRLILDSLDLDSISPERLLSINLVLVYKFVPSSWGSLTCKYMTIKKAKEVIQESNVS